MSLRQAGQGELAAPSHLDTLQGRRERGAEFLSPALWMCLIYSPGGRSKPLAVAADVVGAV